MNKMDLSKISLDKIDSPGFTEKGMEIFVLRLDQIHPVISGNKWFKLRYYLEEAKALKKTTIVTRGGTWSNHIVATAAASQIYEFQSIGIIRGEEPQTYSQTLLQARSYGMQFVFINRENYRQKKIPPGLTSAENYFVEEGGYGKKGVMGAADILSHCNKDYFTHICCAAGSGTMLAGLIQATTPQQRIIGISILKNYNDMENAVLSLLDKRDMDLHINHDFHFGGYAKHKPELLRFMNRFFEQTGIPTDFVYTGKLFYAIRDLIQNDFFREGSRVLVIHSGGLQGNASLNKGTLIF